MTGPGINRSSWVLLFKGCQNSITNVNCGNVYKQYLFLTRAWRQASLLVASFHDRRETNSKIMTHVALNRLELKNWDTARNKRYIQAQAWKPLECSLASQLAVCQNYFTGKMIKTDITEIEPTSFLFGQIRNTPKTKYLRQSWNRTN